MNVFKRMNSIKNSELIRYIWIAAVAFVATASVFFIYYYQDRYVRPEDMSPLDISIEHLEEAVRQNPDDPAARVALAEYYLGKELYSQSLEQTDQVLAASPDYADALLIAGIAYTRMDRSEEAIASHERFVALRKDSPMAMTDLALQAAYYFLGENYNKIGQAQQAALALESALTINSTDADALYQAGLSAQSLNDHEKALGYFNQAVRFVPDFAEAYAGLNESYSALNQPDYAAYASGMQSFSLQDYTAAQVQLQAVTRSLPEFPLAFYGLALTYEQQGNLAEALIAIKTAARLAPDDFSIKQAEGRIEAALKAQG